jgi:hypothetical protein
MATRDFTAAHVAPGTVRIVWTGLLNGDDGLPYSDYSTRSKTAQVLGTFGAAGSVSIESCLEETPVTYAIINDPQGNALTFTTARIEVVQEPSGVIRPRVTAGDGTTSLTVIVITRIDAMS